jgi:hypothetical protein
MDFSLREIENFDTKTLKKEMSMVEIYGLEYVLLMYFRSIGHSYFRISDLEDWLGLPYTSSGDYAGIWVTNYPLSMVGLLGVDGFALSENGMIVIVMSDFNSNLSYYELEWRK